MLINVVEVIIMPIAFLIGEIFQGLGLNEMNTIIFKIETMLEIIIENGVKLTALVVDLDYVRFLIELVITIEIAEELYKIFMWTLKKIPILAIK